jgi:iron complex outermembrane recepter protein
MPTHPALLPFRFFAVLGACGTTLAAGSGGIVGLSGLKQMSLDELMNVQVTSVSRTAEPYREAAAALTVITEEQIRRSGATNLPDALRWVPGLHVARQNSNVWAVSSRGFSSVNSEKLLVQSDTRSIYTPLFSGVLWDVQDYLLADIERIEVIRGPGAAMWGANAVNGVINITTKNAADTHGTRLEAGTGTDELAMVSARHGSQTRGGVHYRVFGKYSERDSTRSSAGRSDDWQFGHLGFRADWTSSAQDDFTLQSDVYQGDIGQLAPATSIAGRPAPTGDLETRVAGGNLLGRWRRRIDENSDLQFRTYYDRTHRDDPTFKDDLDTIDLDLQHRFVPAIHHELMWGLNYRYTSNRNEGKGVFAVRPSSSQDHLFSAFVQDRIAWRDVLRVTLGTKVEHNDFSGFEIQPSVRAAWDITERNTLWAAVSRAARIPTRLERDIYIDVGNPAANPVTRLLGSRDFESEKLLAYELGYRWRAAAILQVDLSLFENRYDGLASLEIGSSFTDPTDGRTVRPIVNRNLTDGHIRGLETLLMFSPFEQWRLSASYSYLEVSLDSPGLDLNRSEFYDGATPRHQFALGSYLNLPGGFELDAHFRRHSPIRRMPPVSTGQGIPAYSELDLRLSWRASPRMRISLVGQNLLHDRHVEFGTPAARGPIRRGISAKVVWGF